MTPGLLFYSQFATTRDNAALVSETDSASCSLLPSGTARGVRW